MALPCTTGTAGPPVPWMENPKGFFNGSLVPKLSAAERRPGVVVAKRTVNVVLLPGARSGCGWALTTKSAAFGPEIATAPRFTSASPMFWTVNVRLSATVPTSAVPKSVRSAATGVVSPLPITVPLPETAMRGPAGGGLSVSGATEILSKSAVEDWLISPIFPPSGSWVWFGMLGRMTTLPSFTVVRAFAPAPVRITSRSRYMFEPVGRPRLA